MRIHFYMPLIHDMYTVVCMDLLSYFSGKRQRKGFRWSWRRSRGKRIPTETLIISQSSVYKHKSTCCIQRPTRSWLSHPMQYNCEDIIPHKILSVIYVLQLLACYSYHKSSHLLHCMFITSKNNCSFDMKNINCF